MAKGRQGVWWRLEKQDIIVMYAVATLVWGMGEDYRCGLGVGLLHGETREAGDHGGGHIETNDCLQGSISAASHDQAERGVGGVQARISPLWTGK
jgi:hypothetical protein